MTTIDNYDDDEDEDEKPNCFMRFDYSSFTSQIYL